MRAAGLALLFPGWRCIAHSEAIHIEDQTDSAVYIDVQGRVERALVRLLRIRSDSQRTYSRVFHL